MQNFTFKCLSNSLFKTIIEFASKILHSWLLLHYKNKFLFFPWVVFCQVSLNPNLWIPILLCSKFQSLLSFSLYFRCSFANLSTMTFSLFQNIFLCRFSPVFLKRGAQKWSNTRAKPSDLKKVYCNFLVFKFFSSIYKAQFHVCFQQKLTCSATLECLYRPTTDIHSYARFKIAPFGLHYPFASRFVHVLLKSLTIPLWNVTPCIQA